MQTRSMSRNKIIPDISDIKTTTTNSKVYENKKYCSKKIHPEVENKIVTRSMNKQNVDNIKFEIKNKVYNISNLLENKQDKVSFFDIDFDDSSRAWMRNKRKFREQ